MKTSNLHPGKAFWPLLLSLGLLPVLALAGEPPPIKPAGPDPAELVRRLETTTAPVAIDAELELVRLAPDTYVASHVPFNGANVLIARMPDGALVLCSSPYETQATRALLRFLRAAFKPPRIVDINTHWHIDGTGGNEAYRADGVEVYASDHTNKLWLERGEGLKAQIALFTKDPARRKRIVELRVVSADHLFPEREGLELALGGEKVRVLYPGAAHSLDNVVVYFPSRKLVFGGCMVKRGDGIGYVADGDLKAWEGSLRKVEQLDATVVVPGHGKAGGRELFENTRRVVRRALQAQPAPPSR